MSEQLQQEFSPEDKALLDRLLSRPLILPPDFKSWLYKFASTDAAPHFQEILGTQERRWRIADPLPDLVYLNETSFADVSPAGPTLTGLENGHYMVVFGFYTQAGSAGSRFCRAEYNDVTAEPSPSDDCDIYLEGQGVMFSTVDLKSNDANKITLKFRVDYGDAQVGYRWLHAVQVA